MLARERSWGAGGRLQKVAPEYEFAASLSGKAELKSGEFTIADGLRPRDFFGFRVQDRLRLKPDPDQPELLVSAERKGMAAWKPYHADEGKEIGGGETTWSGRDTWFLGRSQVRELSYVEYVKDQQPPLLVHYYYAVCITAAGK